MFLFTIAWWLSSYLPSGTERITNRMSFLFCVFFITFSGSDYISALWLLFVFFRAVFYCVKLEQIIIFYNLLLLSALLCYLLLLHVPFPHITIYVLHFLTETIILWFVLLFWISSPFFLLPVLNIRKHFHSIFLFWPRFFALFFFRQPTK